MQSRQYGDYQFDIYLDGLQGKLPRYPVDYTSLERAGAEVLPSWVYSYVAGGAGDGNTQRANVEAFSRYGIVPRMLVGATERDLSSDSCPSRLRRIRGRRVWNGLRYSATHCGGRT
jgi:lactate 2-monooxygenase